MWGYNDCNRTHYAFDSYAQPGENFLFMGCFMYQYLKQINISVSSIDDFGLIVK